MASLGTGALKPGPPTQFVISTYIPVPGKPLGNGSLLAMGGGTITINPIPGYAPPTVGQLYPRGKWGLTEKHLT